MNAMTDLQPARLLTIEDVQQCAEVACVIETGTDDFIFTKADKSDIIGALMTGVQVVRWYYSNGANHTLEKPESRHVIVLGAFLSKK